MLQLVLITVLLFSKFGFSASRILLKTAKHRLNPTLKSYIKIIAISDTHSLHRKKGKNYLKHLPKGDILVHAGDSTNFGNKSELLDFTDFLQEIKPNYKHIVFIAGNHEKILAQNLNDPEDPDLSPDALELMKTFASLAENGIHYVQDELIILEGLKFYGSPWTLINSSNKAFGLTKEDIAKKWENIPQETDILVTHCPPPDPLNLSKATKEIYELYQKEGCDALMSKVLKVNPLLHIFGHIHEGYGRLEGINNQTIFVNAATATAQDEPHNQPIIVTLERTI